MSVELMRKLPEFTVQQAEGWIAALLAQAQALKQHEPQLYPSPGDAAAMCAAEQLHAGWREWTEDAATLHARIAPLLQTSGDIAGARELERVIASARAISAFMPEAIASRREQMARGDIKTSQEVRSELRAAARR